MPSIVYVVYEAIGFRVPCSYCVETNAAAAAAHCLLGGGEGVEVGDALLEDGCFLGGCFGEDAGNNLVDEELLSAFLVSFSIRIKKSSSAWTAAEFSAKSVRY